MIDNLCWVSIGLYVSFEEPMSTDNALVCTVVYIVPPGEGK